MITLDQIKQLDNKVRKAIDRISSLNSKNIMLQEKLDTYQLKVDEFEELINTFKKDQGEIESGIINALNQLDTLDDNSATSMLDSDSTKESTDTENKPMRDQPNIKSDVTKKITDKVLESNDKEKIHNSNNKESKLELSTKNKESELDIF